MEINNAELSYIEITEQEILKTLKSLDTNKANGPGNISNRLLKNTASTISKPLTKLFQKSLETGKFLSKWKKANVSPVFKKNNKQDKVNYRPISLLPNLGKVLERVVFNHLYNYCKEHNLLTWRNSGYKPLDSSINQLIYISHKIYQSLEEGNDVCFISLDASSAFDRVWHEGLFFKLSSKGVCGKLYDWFKSYLSDRFQRVVIKGQFSKWAKILAGVPQGSILGPLLFLIYIDDIVNDIEANILLFADDTSILETISNPILSFERLNRDLSRLNLWSNQWLVTFNPTKTEYIIFSKKIIKQNYPDLYLSNEKLKQVSTHKQLGVTFNSKMTFDDHVRENCKKAMNRITAMKRINSKLSRQSKLTIYVSFIRPVLEFGWELYDNSSVEVLNSLEAVQREGLILVTSAYKKTSHNEILRETGVPILSKRRQMQKVQFMYKYSENKLPNYLNELIPGIVNENVNYNLRNKNNIMMPKSKKNYFLKSFIPSSIKIWNETKLEIRQAISTEALKNMLKSTYCNTSYSLLLMHDGKGAINQSRIRMGLSALNSQRKKYHFIDDSKCNNCKAKSESPMHFMLCCPAYVAHRQQMIHELTQCAPHVMQELSNFENDNKQRSDLVHVLLNGTGNTEVDDLIFLSVQSYIERTERFN